MVESEAKRASWIEALPRPPSYAMAGWVQERLDGMLGQGKRWRYALFDMTKAEFSMYLSEESAFLDDKTPEFRAVVKYDPSAAHSSAGRARMRTGAGRGHTCTRTRARMHSIRNACACMRMGACLPNRYALPRPMKEPGVHEFAFNTDEEHREGKGRFHEFCVESEELQKQWVEALPPPREYTVNGYLYKKVGRTLNALKLAKEENTWEKRYAVYDVMSGYFAYYESEQEALLDMKPRGSARVVSAVMRPTPQYPFMFSFFSDDGKDFQMRVDDHATLQMWMNALPINSNANTDKIMTMLRGELDSLKRQFKNDGSDGDVLMSATMTREQVTLTLSLTLTPTLTLILALTLTPLFP